MLKLTVLLALATYSYALLDQAYAVKGRLICGPKPAANVRVKLWEEDTGPDPDDLLDSGYTDSNGEFRLFGSTAELTPIDPIFKVYHDCDDGIKPGKRKVKFVLPKSYISKGKVPKKEYDIGILNLETTYPKEERELIVTRKRREHHRHHHTEDALDVPVNHEGRGRHERQHYNDESWKEQIAWPQERESRPREGKNPCDP